MRVYPKYFDLYLKEGIPIVLIGVIVFLLPDILSIYNYYDIIPSNLSFNEFSLFSRLLGLGIILLAHVYVFLIQRSTYLDIKPNMIEFKSGIFFWKTSKVPYENITDFQITRSPLNLLLQTGTLYINTSGKDGYEVIFKDGGIEDLRIVEHEIRERKRTLKKK